MNFRLAAKLAAVFFVSLFLLVPVAQVESLVRERQALRDQVVTDIAKSAGYAQTVTGPFLVLPYERIVRTWTEDSNDKTRKLVESVNAGTLVFLPKVFDVRGKLATETRSRGIYEARVFSFTGDLAGEFRLEPNYGVTEPLADYTFGRPYVVLGLSDVRGIGAGLGLTVDGEAVPVEPGTSPTGASHGAPLGGVVGGGVHALLPNLEKSESPRSLRFSIHLGLQGTGEFRVAPVGRESRVSLASNWPHPSFVGDFLPKTRTVTSAGFEAAWDTSFFATNLEGLVERCRSDGANGACAELGGRNFGVSFIDPVDHYLQSERATKYAFLFIGLTFAAFFLLEVLGKRNVHGIQYGLVGLALAVFFLLLLSLAEHLGFAKAYLISASVSVALIGYYVVPLLGKSTRGLAFGGALGALYGVLYGILRSEDYALLAGSAVVFGVLGLVMVLTRRVNWSSFGQASMSAGRATDAPVPNGP